MQRERNEGRRESRGLTYLLLAATSLVLMVAMDDVVSRLVHDHPATPFVAGVLRFVRLPGNYWFTLFLAFVFVVHRRWSVRQVMLLLSSGAVASGVTALLKVCFGRLRPFRGEDTFDWRPFASVINGDLLSGKNLSFPSGDATLAFATAAALSFLEPRYRIAAYAWAIAVACTRVLQGAHYPSDVVAGALIGIATADVLSRFTANVSSTSANRLPIASHA